MLALAAGYSWMNKHLVAFIEIFNIAANLKNVPRPFTPKDYRIISRDISHPNPNVKVIDRSSLYFDKDFIIIYFWSFDFLKLQIVCASPIVQNYGFHFYKTSSSAYFFIERNIFIAGAGLSIALIFPANLFLISVMSGNCLMKDDLSGWGIVAITFPFLL